MWVALHSLLKNNFQDLFTNFGFDKNKLKNEAYTYLGRKIPQTKEMVKREPIKKDLVGSFGEMDAAKIFESFQPKNNKDVKNESKPEEPKIPMTLTETISKVYKYYY